MTQREVRDIARVRNIELLPRLLRLLAALTAQELNAAALARDLGTDDETVRSYLPCWRRSSCYTGCLPGLGT